MLDVCVCVQTLDVCVCANASCVCVFDKNVDSGCFIVKIHQKFFFQTFAFIFSFRSHSFSCSPVTQVLEQTNETMNMNKYMCLLYNVIHSLKNLYNLP